MALVAVKMMRFSVEKIISLSGISDIKNGQKAVISTRILLRKAVNHIQIFVIKTVSNSLNFAIIDIAEALFTLEI